MKLNLGCSDDLKAGWVNVDRMNALDVKAPLGVLYQRADLNWTWPWMDSTADVVYAHDVFEHLESKIQAMNEAWRVLKPGGILDLAVPCVQLADGRVNPGAFADPTHKTFWTWDDQFYFSAQFNCKDGERGRLGPAYGIQAVFEFPMLFQQSDTTWKSDPRALGFLGSPGMLWKLTEQAGGARTKIVGILKAVK